MPSVIELPQPLSSPCLIHSYMFAPIGSAATVRISGLRSFRNIETPASVPPVPIAQVKPSMLPPVCSQISLPVVAWCASTLAGLWYWFISTAPGVAAAMRLATDW